ncbi:MAG: amidohydrolase family protein [Phycisphaerales bacterium]
MSRRAISVFVAATLATTAMGQVELLDETFEYDRDHPAAGHWLGTTQRDSGPAAFVEILIEQTNDTPWQVAVTALSLSARNTPCEDVVIEGRTARFVLGADDNPLVFEGSVSDDGQRLTGSLTPRDDGDAGAERGSFNLQRVPRPLDLDNPMRFSGIAQSGVGIELEISIVLAQTPAGNWVGQIDLPRLGLVAYPIVNIAGDANSIRAEVPLGRHPARIEAILDAQQSHLVGKFRQRGIELSFDLARGERIEPAKDPPDIQLPQWILSSWLVRRHTEEPWALVGGNVIDVVTGEIHRHATIVIAGDLIRTVSTDPPAEGMRVVDISGSFVVPGFFDLHAHVIPKSPRFPGVEGAEATLKNLLESGVTTIRGLPLTSEGALGWAAQINAATLLGPTIVPASSIFEKHKQRTFYGFGDPATVRGWVRKEALLGNRWIKVYNKMDADSLRTIVETAAAYGMNVCGHTEDVPPLEASQIGIASIEHTVSIPLSCLQAGVALADQPGELGSRIAWRWANVDDAKSRQLMRTFKGNATAWVPTLVVTEAIMDSGGHDGVPLADDTVKSQLRQAQGKAAKLAVYLHEIGGLVGLGTDFPIDGVVPGESVHREMEILVEFGSATPLQALQIATVSSAKILGFGELLGSVDAGKIANLVILDANPLENISNTRRVAMVVHDGRLHHPGTQSD